MVDISVKDVVKSFDLEKKILDGITFQVDTGERVGLLGKNGAGKTTLFRLLTGELEPDSGQIVIATGTAGRADLTDPRLSRRVHGGGRTGLRF